MRCQKQFFPLNSFVFGDMKLPLHMVTFCNALCVCGTDQVPKSGISNCWSGAGSDWPSGESGDFPNGQSNGRGIMQFILFIIIIHSRGPVCGSKSRAVFQSQSRPAPGPFPAHAPTVRYMMPRSAERRVGQECRSRWSPDQ